MSSLKSRLVRRLSRIESAGTLACAAGPCACKRQEPLALSTASGMVTLKRFSNHSRCASRAVGDTWLIASTSSRPNFFPCNSNSSATISSAGMLAGCSSSNLSTSCAALLLSVSLVSRAYKRPAFALSVLEAPRPAWRYSIWPLNSVAST